MSVIIRQEKRAPAPAGLWKARCTKVEDLPNTETAFGIKDCVRVNWELEGAPRRDDGEPFSVSRRYTKSLAQRAALTRDVEGWLGRALTRDERFGGVDLETLLVGRECRLQIVHRQGDGGDVFANVAIVAPLATSTPTEKPPASPALGPDDTDEDAPF